MVKTIEILKNSSRLRHFNHSFAIIKRLLINLKTLPITFLDRVNEYTYIGKVQVLTGLILLNSKFKMENWHGVIQDGNSRIVIVSLPCGHACGEHAVFKLFSELIN